MPKLSTPKDRSRRLYVELLEERNPASDMRSLASAIPQTPPPLSCHGRQPCGPTSA